MRPEITPRLLKDLRKMLAKRKGSLRIVREHREVMRAHLAGLRPPKNN